MAIRSPTPVNSIGLTVAKPSWETLFILNIPISLMALAGAWWVLRNVQQPRSAGRFDILGTLMITLALIGLNLGLGTNARIGHLRIEYSRT